MKKVLALFFLFTFCLSLPGFSVEVHYCKGKVTDVSFFGHADCVCKTVTDISEHTKSEKMSCDKQCHGESMNPVSESKIKLQKTCCKTEKLTLTSFKLKAFSSVKKTEIIYAVAVLNPFLLAEWLSETEPVTNHYLSPLYSRDISVLNSVFII